jgi:hypothetical protein
MFDSFAVLTLNSLLFAGTSAESDRLIRERGVHDLFR